ncbi:MAG: class A beta-lactamase [Roseococcus sp.]|nr:class A beta-lactamase [Roseococcus sp.]
MKLARRSLAAFALTPALARAEALVKLEAESGGRLGVAILDSATGRLTGQRLDERFAMTSTVKLLLAAALLARADAGQEALDRRVRVERTALVPWSPVTETRTDAAGLSLAELAEAMMTISDNTAANLILDALGGSAALNAFLRALGDATTRLDRPEPALNEARPGDPRDTTTPAAMVRTLAAVCASPVLSDAARAQLLGWMAANRTGGPLLRAGLPAGWRIGDRTGAGGFHSRGVVAMLSPPEGAAPLFIAAYLHEGPAAMAARDAIFARLGAMIAGGRA